MHEVHDSKDSLFRCLEIAVNTMLTRAPPQWPQPGTCINICCYFGLFVLTFSLFLFCRCGFAFWGFELVSLDTSFLIILIHEHFVFVRRIYNVGRHSCCCKHISNVAASCITITVCVQSGFVWLAVVFMIMQCGVICCDLVTTRSWLLLGAASHSQLRLSDVTSAGEHPVIMKRAIIQTNCIIFQLLCIGQLQNFKHNFPFKVYLSPIITLGTYLANFSFNHLPPSDVKACTWRSDFRRRHSWGRNATLHVITILNVNTTVSHLLTRHATQPLESHAG